MSDALDAALPSLPPLHRSRRQARVERRQQRIIAEAIDRVNFPLPRSAWGAIGRSVVVPPARIESPECIFIGNGVVVHEHSWFSVVRAFDDIVPRVVLEDRVRIGRCCQLSVAGELVVEHDALIGDFVQIGDTSHPYQAKLRMPELTRPEPVRIGARAVLASHVVVLPGVTIGAGAYVDHHAVVTADVKPGATVRGNPAKEVTR